MTFDRILPAKRCLRRRCGTLIAGSALLAAALATADQPSVASGGFWRDAAGTGFYRATVLPDAGGASIRIEWVAADERGIVASVILADLAEDGLWHISNAELRPAGAETLLLLSTHVSESGEQRSFTVALGAPGVAIRRNAR
jgi:hypothetical protein